MIKSRKIKVDYRQKIMELLKVPADLAPDKLENILQSRIFGVGVGSFCHRCGGSGHYSFNQVSGTRCFRCGGRGSEVIPAKKMNEALYNEVEQAVKSGKLDEYMNNVVIKTKANQVQKRVNTALTTWQNVGLKYDWMKASDKGSYDAYISDNFNAPLFKGHKALEALSGSIDSLLFKLNKLGKNDPKRDSLDDEIKAKLSEFDMLYGAYIKLADVIKKEYDAYVTKQK